MNQQYSSFGILGSLAFKSSESSGSVSSGMLA